MKENMQKRIGAAAVVVVMVAFVVYLFCTLVTEEPGSLVAEAEAREQTKEQTWEQEVEEAEAKREYSALEDIHYFYDPEVDICYAVVVYSTGYSKAVGLTVVPYKKVKNRAIIIGTPKDQTPKD